jgi:AcrR family transcriptional regulator
MVADPTGSPRIGRPKTLDRDRVIGIAMESYWRDGVGTVSLNEVCRRAETSKPGIYREFGGEDGLMDAVLERYAETVLAPTFEQIAQDRPFRDVLATVLEMLTDTSRALPPGCLFVKMRTSPSRLGAATGVRVAALREGARAIYVEWIDGAKQRGEIAPGVSTVVAALLLDTQCTALLMQMALGEDPELLRAQAWLAFAGLTGSVDGSPARA